jgi:hypothetical protein
MKKMLIITVVIFSVILLCGFLYAVVMVKSEQIHSFEECENSGWLVREIYNSDDGIFSKVCVLWSGKKLNYVESTIFSE